MTEQLQAMVPLIPAFRDREVSISPLSGGITNRNYYVEAGNDRYVLRVGGVNTALLGIDRDVEHACSVAAARVGVGPEVIAFLPEHEVSITRFVEGRVLEPEDIQRPDVMRRVVESLRRYHDGPPIDGFFSPFNTVGTYSALAREHDVDLPDSLGHAMDLLRRIEEALATDEPACPCHNDLLAANFVDDGSTVWIIDWEYAGMGDRFFDLGNLAVNSHFEERHERALLELYFGEVRDDDRRRLRLMRLASDMRESLWGFLQSGISTLDFDFLHYGHEHLQRFLEMATVDPQLLRTTV